MEQIKILINLSNLNIGGAYQRAVSFVKNWSDYSLDNAILVCRSDMKNDILKMTDLRNLTLLEVDHSPASILNGRETRKVLNETVKKYNVKVAFTFVGPAYWRAKCYHIVGFGVPHIVYDDLPYVRSLPVLDKLKFTLKKLVTKYEANHWVVQTRDVQKRLVKRLDVDIENVSVVSNGPGRQFDENSSKRSNSDRFRLITPTTFRPSKNLDIIARIAPPLHEENVVFYVTLDKANFQRLFGGLNNVVNLGKISPVDLPMVYEKVDALFLPSHLECFSASYVESMFMGIPIITSDLPFAKTVCNDAAIYFNNVECSQAIDSILLLKNSPEKLKSLVEKGYEILKHFDTSKTQYNKYIKIIKNAKHI